MSQPMSAAVASLRRASDVLAEATPRLARADPGPRAFGGDGPGRLGELGRELHHRWQRALDARARETAAHAIRLDEAAATVARAVDGYAEIDEAVRGHQPEES